MELKYKEGDIVFVKARVEILDGEYLPYRVESLSSGNGMLVRPMKSMMSSRPPNPPPAASTTRPDGYPPVKMGKPYRVGTYDDDSSSHLNYLTEWGIEFEVLGFAAYTETYVGPFTSVLFRVTAVSQMYLDAVAEKQADDAKPTQFDPSAFGPSGKPFGSPRQD